MKLVDAASTQKQAATISDSWPPALDLEALAEREPEAPKFIMADWLPCEYASLMAGHGGVGKSGIALHLAVCIAAGVPFFGIQVERRRVAYLSCEDRENVLHWRLARICAHTGIDLASLRGWLNIHDLVGRDSILWERDPRSNGTFTAGFGNLVELLEDYETELLVVDGITDTFGGNENAKTEVKRFVNALLALVPADRGAVLLVGHMAKLQAQTGTRSEGYSGSTAWHNSVRARWYLYPETEEAEDGGRPERTGDLILELQKSNLGRTDQEMRFRWDDQAHLFVGEPVSGMAFDRTHQERDEQNGILRAFRACANSTPATDVPAATMGRRTAYHVLSVRPEFPDSLKGAGKAKTRRFWKRIEELRAKRYLEERSIPRTDRHLVRCLTITQEGLRACGQCE